MSFYGTVWYLAYTHVWYTVVATVAVTVAHYAAEWAWQSFAPVLFKTIHAVVPEWVLIREVVSYPIRVSIEEPGPAKRRACVVCDNRNPGYACPRCTSGWLCAACAVAWTFHNPRRCIWPCCGIRRMVASGEEVKLCLFAHIFPDAPETTVAERRELVANPTFAWCLDRLANPPIEGVVLD